MASSSRLICHGVGDYPRSEEHTSELQSLRHLVCRLLLGKKKHTSELQSLRHLVCRLLLEKKDHKYSIPSPRKLTCQLYEISFHIILTVRAHSSVARSIGSH